MLDKAMIEGNSQSWHSITLAIAKKSSPNEAISFIKIKIRPQVEFSNQGKIVAIDIETGNFEIDAREIAACNRLEARHPDAQIWIVRVGSRHVRRFGGRTKRAV